MAPTPLAVVATIKPEQRCALERVLSEIGQDINNNQYLRFPEIPTTHFARFVMIGGGVPADRDTQTRLLFSSTHDGSSEEYVDLLLCNAAHGMDAIWSKCEGYPALSPSDPHYRRAFKRFIKAHTSPPTSFYAGYNLSVSEIKACIALRDQLQTLLDQDQFARLLDILALVPPVQDRWAPLHKLLGKLGEGIRQVLLKTLQAVLTPNLAKNRGQGAREAVDTRPDLTEWFYTVQNEMTVISAIKPEQLQELRRFFRVLNLLVRYVYKKGSLSGIATIHAARWTIIDNGRNLLFESNYDGSWEQYIGDFVDKAARNMDAIWHATPGYPTRGAKDLEGFKQVIIDHQVRAQVFYSAYPQDSLRNLLNDIELSRKLSALLGQKPIANVLSRL
jgi:hypothetical protein